MQQHACAEKFMWEQPFKHPNVMPALDSDVSATWLVMPLAIDNLEVLRQEVLEDDELQRVVEHVCDGLAACPPARLGSPRCEAQQRPVIRRSEAPGCGGLGRGAPTH
jgi:hypothetical protein